MATSTHQLTVPNRTGSNKLKCIEEVHGINLYQELVEIDDISYQAITYLYKWIDKIITWEAFPENDSIYIAGGAMRDAYTKVQKGIMQNVLAHTSPADIDIFLVGSGPARKKKQQELQEAWALEHAKDSEYTIRSFTLLENEQVDVIDIYPDREDFVSPIDVLDTFNFTVNAIGVLFNIQGSTVTPTIYRHYNALHDINYKTLVSLDLLRIGNNVMEWAYDPSTQPEEIIEVVSRFTHKIGKYIAKDYHISTTQLEMVSPLLTIAYNKTIGKIETLDRSLPKKKIDEDEDSWDTSRIFQPVGPGKRSMIFRPEIQIYLPPNQTLSV